MNPPGRPATKDTNRARLLRQLRRYGPMPRVALARRTRLSAGAVSAITGELIEQGVLCELAPPPAEPQSGSRGRPPVELGLAPGHARVAALSIRMNLIEGVVTDFSGTPLARHVVECQTRGLDPSAVVERCAEAIAGALERAPGQGLQGIGLAAQGMVDPAAGRQLWSPVLRTGAMSLAAPLADRFGVPVLVENDAAATSLALVQDHPDLQRGLVAVLMIGHGVGMGLLRDGGPFPGSRGFSSEIGHVRRIPGGAQCRCGQRGCIEAYLADYALYRDGRSLADLPQTDSQQPTDSQMVEFARRAEAGEPGLRALFAEAGRALSDAISIVSSVLAPRRIAVTGSGLRALHLMEPSYRAALAGAFAPGLVPDRDVVFVPGGTERITAGMAHLALEAVDAGLAERPGRPASAAAGG
ncbi:ROK family protein [Thalassobaculum sp.]|uniref:ROK family protein n=1 Tax=Thalassobaculum sp. TaxID=2022740 RepID=UPI0032EC7B81